MLSFKWLKWVLVAAVVAFSPTIAQAQCTGIFGANKVCGSAAGGLPSQMSLAFSNLTGSVACGQLPALTGDVTSSGCATTVASTTGTGAFVRGTSPSITTPTITGGTLSALTGLAIRSTGAAFDLTFASTEVLTAGRTLTFTLNDAARILNLGGNLTISNAFSTSGGIVQLVVAADATATIPSGNHTLAGIDVAQTWSANQQYNDGTFILKGSSSGSSTVKAPATGGGTATIFAGSDTFVGKATTDTLTNKTYDTAGTGNSFLINGVAATANTGTGAVARATSPVFVTPTLGAASATSINGLIITATLGTLTIPNNASAALILSGNFSTTLTSTGATNATLPNGTHTLAALDLASQVISGGATVTSLSQSTGNITMDCGTRPIQTITNGGAYTITAPSSDGYCVLKVTNNASAGATTFSGFSVGSSTGDALTTTNGNKFMIFVYRAGGDSTYSIKALQ